MKESFRINGESFIVPIPKPKKDQSVPANYRPILLTSVICKVTERMINNRLLDYLKRIPSFGRIQCGGLKGRSMTDQFVHMESAIRKAFVNNDHLISVFIDLEKVYDLTFIDNFLKERFFSS